MTLLLTYTPKTQEVYAKRNINFTDYDAYIKALYLAMNAGIMYDTEPQRFEDEFSDDARLIVNGPEKVYFPVWFTEVIKINYKYIIDFINYNLLFRFYNNAMKWSLCAYGKLKFYQIVQVISTFKKLMMVIAAPLMLKRFLDSCK